jgi:hypothetical protein
MIQPLFIEWLWRWELWLAMTAADVSSGFNIGERSLVLKIQ